MHKHNQQFSEPDFPRIVDEQLEPSWDFGVAAQHIVLSHFRRMLGWREVVQRNEEIEGVHQIRVEARRTRTALQTFADIWDGSEVKRFSKYLADFATAFGDARDTDVMIIYLTDELTRAEAERAAAYGWLLERNRERRQKIQPKLEECLAELERSGFPAAFTAYFSTHPFDLWSIPAAVVPQPEPSAAPEPVESRNG